MCHDTAQNEANHTQRLQFLLNPCLAGSGTINFSEFLAMMKKMKAEECDGTMLEAFKVFDKDGNGFIKASELKAVMATMNDNLTDEEVNEILRDADIDSDGQVSYAGE